MFASVLWDMPPLINRHHRPGEMLTVLQADPVARGIGIIAAVGKLMHGVLPFLE